MIYKFYNINIVLNNFLNYHLTFHFGPVIYLTGFVAYTFICIVLVDVLKYYLHLRKYLLEGILFLFL